MNIMRTLGLSLVVATLFAPGNAPGQQQEALASPVLAENRTTGEDDAPTAAASDSPAPSRAAVNPVLAKPRQVAAAPAIGFVPDDTHFKLEARGPNPAAEPYRAALRAEAAGQWERALNHAREALALDSEYLPARLVQGRILVRTRQYDAASAELSALTRSAETDWQAWFWLGTAQLLQGELATAAASLDESLRRNGKVAETWIQRALIEQQRGDYRTSLQLLEIANDLAPDHPAVLLNLAYCSEALGNGATAQAAYRKFLTRAGRGEVDATARVAVLRHLTELAGDAGKSPRGIADAN